MLKNAIIVLFCCALFLCGCEKIKYVTETSYITETSIEVSYIEPEKPNNYKIIDVPLISQKPQLPTGCESTAAAMVLSFYGESITHTEFARNWLPKSNEFYTVNGIQHGPDPNTVFAGDPFSQYAYGCYAPVITRAINSNSRRLTAKTLKNLALSRLCTDYIDNGIPVLIWATIGMTESTSGKSWITPDGEKFTWTSGEHCLVLVGYNDEYYFFNDPLYGNTVGYKKDIVEHRYYELGMQAVVCDLIA